MSERELKLPLHRKYRPHDFDNIVGNESVVKSIESVLSREDGIPTTYLLHGPSGCGKTTVARIIASTIDGDLKELNISKQGGINEARDIIDKSRYMALSGRAKVTILNECHRANTNFWNALLEVLEEPPPNTYFILCTTEPERVIKAVRTRCHQYLLSSLNSRDMSNLLNSILELEGFDGDDIEALKPVVSKIIKYSDGSPRNALVLLDGVIDLEDITEMEHAVDRLTASSEKMVELCKALKSKQDWKKISRILQAIEEEPETVRYYVLAFFNSELLSSGNSRFAYIIDLFKETFIYSKEAGLTQACFMAIIDED